MVTVPLPLNKCSRMVPGGSATPTVFHNLNTDDIASVTVYALKVSRVGPYKEPVLVGWWPKDHASVVLEFAEVITDGQYQVVMAG